MQEFHSLTQSQEAGCVMQTDTLQGRKSRFPFLLNLQISPSLWGNEKPWILQNIHFCFTVGIPPFSLQASEDKEASSIPFSLIFNWTDTLKIQFNLHHGTIP